MFVQHSPEISIDEADRRQALDDNGYTRGWGYFLQLCLALDNRPPASDWICNVGTAWFGDPPRLELHDWAEQLLCVPEMRQVIREEHAKSHNKGVVIPIPAIPRLYYQRTLVIRTQMRAHMDRFEVVFEFIRNTPAYEYASRMLNQERNDALEAALVAGVSAQRVTIRPVDVSNLDCTLTLSISPDLGPYEHADALFQHLKTRLCVAVSNDPSLRAVMPAVLIELHRQFLRAVRVVFT